MNYRLTVQDREKADVLTFVTTSVYDGLFSALPKKPHQVNYLPGGVSRIPYPSPVVILLFFSPPIYNSDSPPAYLIHTIQYSNFYHHIIHKYFFLRPEPGVFLLRNLCSAVDNVQFHLLQ